jgi:drug/metabolite transporter (DMT)-like permease
VNPYLALALTSLFWSGNHIVGRAIAGHVPPYNAALFRWLLPLIFALPFVHRYLRRDWPHIVDNWKILLFAGLTGGAIFSAAQYVGLGLTTALNTSVLNSITPVAIVAVGALFFRERLSALQILGIFVSSMGVLLLISRGDFRTLTSINFNYGDLIILGNMILFAIYSCALRKLPKLHWLTFIFVIAAISSCFLIPLAVWELVSGQHFEVSLRTVSALLYFGIFVSFLGYALWSNGLEKLGASRGGPFLHLIPIYSAVLAYIFLGEQLMAFHALGFALILCGVWAASGRKAIPENASR